MATQKMVFVVATAAASAVAAPAGAQDSSIEASAGYAFMRDEVTDLSFPLGWVAGVAGKLNGWLAAVGEVGGHYKTIAATGSDLRFSVHSVMAGARASGRIGGLSQFGQFLVGFIHERGTAFQVSSSRRAYALQTGAGVDYNITRTLAARLQVDVRVTVANTSDIEPGPQVRVLAALVRGFR